MSHRCPGKSCTTRVSDLELACRKHWYRLPQALRSKLRATAKLPVTDPKRRPLLEQAIEVWNPK